MEHVNTASPASVQTSGAASEFIEVKIGGELYCLKLGAGHKPAYLQALARFVDAEMAKFKQQVPACPHKMLLMLTLLNFAERIYQEPPPASGAEQRAAASAAGLGRDNETELSELAAVKLEAKVAAAEVCARLRELQALFPTEEQDA